MIFTFGLLHAFCDEWMHLREGYRLGVFKTPIHYDTLNIKSITQTSMIPKQRQQEIDKYLRNSERGFLPMSHDGTHIN